LTISVVITGASGFIGRALCEKLEEKKEYKIIKVTSSQNRIPGFYQVSNYRQSPPGDILIHLGEDSDRTRVNQAGDFYREDTGQVMEALLKKRYKKIVYCSSSIVYGNQGIRLYSEDMPTYADDVYSKAKLENEERVLCSGGLVVRFSNLIGNGMSKNNVLSDILKQLSGKHALIIRNLQPIQDFLWIDDAIDALVRLVQSDKSGIFNIGSSVAISIQKLIKIVLNIAGQDGREIKSIIKSPSYSFNALNIEKIKKVTGWQPKYTLTQSLKKIIKSYE
jgi:UDP-glucose 4-epimerase